MTEFVRAWALDDIRIRTGGDGRTVEAYAAVFDSPTEVQDQDGHYQEVIHRSAFNKTIADRGTRFGVLFNHGMTVWGTPAERYSLPIGTAVEVRADQRGLLTVTRYNNTPQAEEVLEAINSGGITAYSFSGRFMRSDPLRTPRGGFRPAAGGTLRTVTRHEVAMREYGPATFAAYPDAAIVGVRAQQMLGALLSAPPEQAQNLLQQYRGLTTSIREPGSLTDTPSGAVEQTEGEPREHSARSIAQRIRAARDARGMGAST
jgi:HK97 family phage prohead protease